MGRLSSPTPSDPSAESHGRRAVLLVFLLALLPQPPFGYAAVQVLWSALAYPLIVGAARLVLDLRKPATGETDDYGRRL